MLCEGCGNAWRRVEHVFARAGQAPQDGRCDEFPVQPLETDERGTLRFKRNAIVRFMLDTLRNLGAFDLNKAAMMEFSDADRQQFAQLIGYSLSGYSELSYVTDEAYGRAAARGAGADAT